MIVGKLVVEGLNWVALFKKSSESKRESWERPKGTFLIGVEHNVGELVLLLFLNGILQISSCPTLTANVCLIGVPITQQSRWQENLLTTVYSTSRPLLGWQPTSRKIWRKVSRSSVVSTLSFSAFSSYFLLTIGRKRSSSI